MLRCIGGQLAGHTAPGQAACFRAALVKQQKCCFEVPGGHVVSSLLSAKHTSDVIMLCIKPKQTHAEYAAENRGWQLLMSSAKSSGRKAWPHGSGSPPSSHLCWLCLLAGAKTLLCCAVSAGWAQAHAQDL